jgi:quercetin dioxygenase-like cupin family protein
MTDLLKKSFDTPDEITEFPRARRDVVHLGDAKVFRWTFEPGWRWVESVAEIVGAESCPAPHILFTISGRLSVQMDNGTTSEVGPGEMMVIPPGHDAWTVGDEPYIGIDLGTEIYEKLSL